MILLLLYEKEEHVVPEESSFNHKAGIVSW